MIERYSVMILVDAASKEEAISKRCEGEVHAVGLMRFKNARHKLEPKAAVPYASWPIWARALKMVSTPDDKGIGDVVARMIGHENSAAFKAWYKKTTGKDCGCTGRQKLWNLLYPL